MPKRINKAIELLEQGQPVYYTVVTSPLTYEYGAEMAATWADYITVEMEHIPWDMKGLGEFMRGLGGGGPTASGHRTPPVLVSLPTDGTSEEVMRANAWMIKQALNQGVHGIILCHAETPGAVKALVESCRYSHQTIGVGSEIGQGRRGHSGQSTAADIWGISTDEYLCIADVWPLNPEGELLLGIKIENQRALANAEATVAVPGVGYAEWGAGDMAMSFGYPEGHDPPYRPEVWNAAERVRLACKVANVPFLDLVGEDTVIEQLERGVMVGSSGLDGEAAARKGREYTARTMAV